MLFLMACSGLASELEPPGGVRSRLFSDCDVRVFFHPRFRPGRLSVFNLLLERPRRLAPLLFVGRLLTF